MPLKLKAVTWNVHSWIGRNGRRDPEHSLEIIKNFKADFVALQEVELPVLANTENSEKIIREKTGLEVVFGPTLKKRQGLYGNVVLSALPIISVRRLDLSVKPREPRGAIELILQASQTPVRVLATHLGLSAKERHKQLEILLESLDKNPIEPTVFLGDLNEWRPGNNFFKKLAHIFFPAPACRSFPARLPLACLDRVFVKPAPDSITSKTLSFAGNASDHLPLQVEISWSS
jgi:endonuclease/exonuclease/phosphatase family metal-dependent hydrolase